MAKFNDEWTVGPHGPLEAIDDGLLTVEGEIVMPLGRFPRRMTVARLVNGGTAIWSGIPLREPEMRQIEALGAPSFLIVPGIGHRLDLKPWKQRYPAAKIVCAPGAREAVEEVLPADGLDSFSDAEVKLEVVPGVGERELAMHVRRGGRLSLLLNDILANVQHPHGLGAHVMARLMGFGVSRPKMPWVGKRMFVDDEKALAAAFRVWAAEPELTRIIVSHGNPITRDVKAVLEGIAAELDG